METAGQVLLREAMQQSLLDERRRQTAAAGGGAAGGSQAADTQVGWGTQARTVASCSAAVWTEIYVRNVCSCRELLRRSGGRLAHAGRGGWRRGCAAASWRHK
jgi:hypothetical protein